MMSRSHTQEQSRIESTYVCLSTFDRLKKALVSAPIITPPYWSLPFKIMCNASDYAIGAVLGQKKDNRLHMIYYASRKLTEA